MSVVLKLGSCIDDILDDYLPVKELGSGAQGTVYELCREGICDYALKVVQLREGLSEGEIAYRAGEIGVGPEVLRYGTCESNGIDYEYIIMNKLDRVLTDIYPYNPELFVRALEQYNTLMKEGIEQNDLKASNIMLDKDDNLFIVDYGVARIRKASKAASASNLVANARILLDSAFSQSENYGTSGVWSEDPDPNKFNQYVHVSGAVTDYLQKHGALRKGPEEIPSFPDDPSYYIIQPSWSQWDLARFDLITERIYRNDQNNYEYSSLKS